MFKNVAEFYNKLFNRNVISSHVFLYDQGKLCQYQKDNRIHNTQYNKANNPILIPRYKLLFMFE